MRKLAIIWCLLLALSTVPLAVHAMQPPTYTYPPIELLGPLGDPKIPIQAYPGGSIGLLKHLQDGTAVRVCGKIVTGVVPDADMVFYVQEPDRSAGIRVVVGTSISIEAGNVADISGTMGTVDGERVLRATSVSLYQSQGQPAQVGSADSAPVLICLDALGGGPLGRQGGVRRSPSAIGKYSTTCLRIEPPE